MHSIVRIFWILAYVTSRAIVHCCYYDAMDYEICLNAVLITDYLGQIQDQYKPPNEMNGFGKESITWFVSFIRTYRYTCTTFNSLLNSLVISRLKCTFI